VLLYVNSCDLDVCSTEKSYIVSRVVNTIVHAACAYVPHLLTCLLFEAALWTRFFELLNVYNTAADVFVARINIVIIVDIVDARRCT